MKYLLILTLLGSCALPKHRFNKKVPVVKRTYIDRMESCVFKLIEDNGINAKDARETCVSIYRRK
jgi:hypothetical protein